MRFQALYHVHDVIVSGSNVEYDCLTDDLMLQAAQQAVQTLQSHVAGAQLNVEESNTIQNDVLLQVVCVCARA